MKTRPESEMLSLILGFAAEDERIRAILLNGSRANPTIASDPFQDYDIAYLVTDVEPFRDAEYVLPRFGDALIVQTPEDMVWPPPLGGGHNTYLVQLADGNRIDLSFYHLTQIGELLEDSLTAVLLDKDGLIPPLPPASERSYFVRQPTAKLYSDCCNEFFFGLGSHLPKTLWRRQLLRATFYIQVVLREPLLKMLSWEVGVRYGFDRSIGKASWRLQELLPMEEWATYERTYAGSDWGEIWESVLLLYELFCLSAEFVADRLGFEFPAEDARRAMAFLQHVWRLPGDTAAIC